MSQSLRQNNLFLGQDWRVLYQAMSQVNFNAYDYDTIRQALIDYIRLNYPEDFNDWIESSEFVAIIELLAYLASSLAFRLDLNIRENFIDTATRRDSIFRLARLISYNPRRCIAAQGLVKLTQVITDQNIYDSNGFNLANVPVIWNDANNPDWFEQFILVLNASFSKVNPFGQPVKSGAVNGLTVERYDLDNTVTRTLAFPFTGVVNGQQMNFEFVNTDFVNSVSGSITVGSAGYYREKTPNYIQPWSVLYRNDGNGNASPDTGFFGLFKQGTLSFTDFVLSEPLSNRVLDLTALNVNESDVWVETVDDQGNTLVEWTKVPALFGTNIAYNSLNRSTRDIFQVITRDISGTDSISIKFSDGNFGNIPVGRIRVYFRTSNNLTYTILPQDISSVPLSLSYYRDNDGTSQNLLQMQFDLQSSVANSLSRESNAFIRERAPAVFYSQNRMVNGEDYNVYPLISSQALKIKSVNRVYSGQSRYIDINDPTSTYQNSKVFSDDGILFEEEHETYIEVPNSLNVNNTQILDTYIQPLIQGSVDSRKINTDMRDFYLAKYPKRGGGNIQWTNQNPSNTVFPNAHFYTQTVDFVLALPDTTYGIRKGSYLFFANGTSSYLVDEGNSVSSAGNAIISSFVPNGTMLSSVIPSFKDVLLSAEKDAVKNALDEKLSFGISYIQLTGMWQIISTSNLAVDADFSLAQQGNTANQNLDASWLIQLKYVPGFGWYITSRGLKYVFESVNDVRFYTINTSPVISSNTGLANQDFVKILRVNTNLATNLSFSQDWFWPIASQQLYPDGYIEPRRVQVRFQDSNFDGIVDNPDEFKVIVDPDREQQIDLDTGLITGSSFPYVFWKTTVINGFDYLTPTTVDKIFTDLISMSTKYPPNPLSWNDGEVAYVRDQKLFFKYQFSNNSLIDVTPSYKAAVGRNDLNYCWQHFIDKGKRVDPAIMNIIDTYVLTSSYDTAMRNWIARGKTTDPMPQPPAPEDLRITFAEFDTYKMMTDQLIWHPVKYKLLFGQSADPELRVSFKVVKNSGVSITDSEIKARIIRDIDNYFSIANWDFGQSFFFTELAAYIHQQNPAILNSLVIVPQNQNSSFGDLFEIKCQPDEIFISSARVTDILIVPSLNQTELRLK
jgi:hypothetical protein